MAVICVSLPMHMHSMQQQVCCFCPAQLLARQQRLQTGPTAYSQPPRCSIVLKRSPPSGHHSVELCTSTCTARGRQHNPRAPIRHATHNPSSNSVAIHSTPDHVSPRIWSYRHHPLVLRLRPPAVAPTGSAVAVAWPLVPLLPAPPLAAAALASTAPAGTASSSSEADAASAAARALLLAAPLAGRAACSWLPAAAAAAAARRLLPPVLVDGPAAGSSASDLAAALPA